MSDKTIFAPFVKMVPTEEIPFTEDPLKGHIINYNEKGELTFTPIDSFRKLITTGTKGEATPSSSPTPWTPGSPELFEKWDVKTAGTYANFKDATNTALVVTTDPDLKNNFVQIWVKNGVSQKVLSEKPNNTAKTTFDPNNNADPSTMKATYDASEQLVNKAFSPDLTPDINYGWGTEGSLISNPTSVSNRVMSNNIFASKDGIVSKIRVKYSGIGAVTFVVCSIVSGVIQTHQSLNVNLIDGLNEINVGLPILAGQTVGFLWSTGAKVFFTDGGSHQYFTNASGNLVYYNGYMAYEFTVTHPTSSYTVESIKSILDSVATPAPTTQNTIHSRISIEGQSNALGVGFTSGLTSSPFNTALFDWNKAFSRVFIWNPKTAKYENIKIGINNMASWDPDYLHPTSGPTASSFGPEVGIALIWLQTHSVGNLYIDKNVGDGRPIDFFQKGQPYYTEKLNRKTNADQWLADRGIKVNEMGFIWVQGENDKNQTKTYYKGQLDQLIQDRINDGFINSSTVLVITQINPTSAGFGQGVFDAKAEFISSNKMARSVTYSNNLNMDNIHLNTTGQINLGMDATKEIVISDSLNFTNLETKIYWTK